MAREEATKAFPFRRVVLRKTSLVVRPELAAVDGDTSSQLEEARLVMGPAA